MECKGCGWCCLHDQCELSHRLYGFRRRCPDIRWDEAQGRYLCALVLDPGHADEARKALFLGQGCCNRFTSWREDVRNRDREFPD
ncbi:MAG: hypothetical protein AB7E32_00100 [Desulfovibrio sp.]